MKDETDGIDLGMFEPTFKHGDKVIVIKTGKVCVVKLSSLACRKIVKDNVWDTQYEYFLQYSVVGSEQKFTENELKLFDIVDVI